MSTFREPPMTRAASTNKKPEATNDIADLYDEEYYERGAIRGISGYVNYGWLPELTIRMAHHLISQLGIKRHHKVLDYGCAKGFLVKALRLLDIDAYGVDISEYAIDSRPSDVAQYCAKIEGCDDPACFARTYDWFISKDVFEHIPEASLRDLLENAKSRVKHMFLAIPLGKDGGEAGFLIPEYDRDITHITIKPYAWWKSLFEESGWRIDYASYDFFGIKENWTRVHARGNAFFVLSSPDLPPLDLKVENQ
jgi:SAM-dependent methyltransferase